MSVIQIDMLESSALTWTFFFKENFVLEENLKHSYKRTSMITK